jgi:hypothetical protein
MDDACDGQAELWLVILDGVASGKHCTGFRDLAESPCHDLMQNLRLQLLGREHGQVEAGDGSPSHGVDVADGIGCGDLAEGERIIHRRSDEICGRDQGDLVREAIDPRIVARFVANKEIGILVLGQLG